MTAEHPTPTSLMAEPTRRAVETIGRLLSGEPHCATCVQLTRPGMPEVQRREHARRHLVARVVPEEYVARHADLSPVGIDRMSRRDGALSAGAYAVGPLRPGQHRAP